MARRVAQFYKVSFGQFKEGFEDVFGRRSEEEIQALYDRIRLPRRATAGSAGYDFFSPVDLELAPGETVQIPPAAE